MEDEPEEVTFNVDRVRHSQLKEPSDPFAVNYPPQSDFCIGFLCFSVDGRYGFNFGDTQLIIFALRFRNHHGIHGCRTNAKNTVPTYSGTSCLRDRIPH